MFDYNVCAETDGQFFWSGAPWVSALNLAVSTTVRLILCANQVLRKSVDAHALGGCIALASNVRVQELQNCGSFDSGGETDMPCMSDSGRHRINDLS